MSVTIYHNPRCSKSRQTLELIRDSGFTPEIVEYLKSPPDRQKLLIILRLLEMSPRDLMRKGEPEYSENCVADTSLSDDQLIDMMIKFPILIERPIVIANGKAVLGRPPENVLELLES